MTSRLELVDEESDEVLRCILPPPPPPPLLVGVEDGVFFRSCPRKLMPPLIKFERLRNRLCDAPSSRAECGEWGLVPLCLGLRAGDPPAEAEPLRKAEGRVLDMVMIVGIGFYGALGW